MVDASVPLVWPTYRPPDTPRRKPFGSEALVHSVNLQPVKNWREAAREEKRLERETAPVTPAEQKKESVISPPRQILEEGGKGRGRESPREKEEKKGTERAAVAFGAVKRRLTEENSRAHEQADREEEPPALKRARKEGGKKPRSVFSPHLRRLL